MTFLDATDSAGLTLRVQFIHRGDRYCHAILAVDLTGHEHPLLESIEGTANDDWPPSPPLQSLSIEELAPGRRAALLLGMAGRSHWSASIEAVPGQAALIFDIACRTVDKRGPLGSVYRVFAETNSHVAIEPELDCVANRDVKDRIAIVPTVALGATTTRWKYRVGLARA
jgi:hypothetical protein